MKFRKVVKMNQVKQGQIFRSAAGNVCVAMSVDSNRVGYYENAGLWVNCWKNSERGQLLVEVK